MDFNSRYDSSKTNIEHEQLPKNWNTSELMPMSEIRHITQILTGY